MTEPIQSRPPSALSRFLRRVRRNRFWLLLYLWLALLLPAVVLREAAGESAFEPLRLFLMTLTPAMAVFILCTAIPAPGVNFAISAVCSIGVLLFCALRLVCARALGAELSLLTLMRLWTLLRYGWEVREVLSDILPPLLLMGVPTAVLLTLGRKLFSFRPLKSWKQHIPMVIACVLSALVSGLCLFLPGGEVDTPPSVPAETVPPVTVALTAPSQVLADEVSGSNILNLDLDALAAREEREEIALIHRYFAGRIPSEKNEKTGLFRGCNLIQITVSLPEGTEISEEQTPTLSRMTREGFVLSNYSILQWDGSLDGDHALLTGTFPAGDSEAAAGSYQPLTMVQQLIPQGYSAWALHCCQGGACPRTRCLEGMGYECAQYTLPLRDALDRALGTYMDRAPFTLYCTMDALCGTQPLEETLELLITRLDQADILENTVVLLSVDAEQDRCILWKPGTVSETVETSASPLDLLPTLSNLFGLTFDSRLYMGRDLFSDAPPTEENTGEQRLISSLISEYDYWRILFP